MSDEIFIAGHSLGAARAYQYAYSRIMRGLRVDGIYAFAPPNPGNSVIGDVLKQVPLIRALKNGRDIVPDVPVDIAWIGEEYVQPRSLEEVNEAPPANAEPIFGWHSMDLYLAGARKLTDARSAPIAISFAAEQVSRLYHDGNGWDWINIVDGAYWAELSVNGARLLIARGSATLHDWLDDFDAAQILVMNARMARGFWRGVGPMQEQLDTRLK